MDYVLGAWPRQPAEPAGSAEAESPQPGEVGGSGEALHPAGDSVQSSGNSPPHNLPKQHFY